VSPVNQRNLCVFALALALAPVASTPVFAQGCIVARSASFDLAPESQGGYLQEGDWELTIGYRHQFSYKHFVGDVEQAYRVQQGNQVMNKVNLQNVDVTYQASPRVSVTLSMPFLFASRRSNNSYYTTHSSGLGDSSILARAWLWNPRRAKRGNISVGLGLQAPTGKDNVQNNVYTSAAATTPTLTTVDYSIQPGSGGWGVVLQWQAFREIGGGFTAYTAGNYVATQGGNNGVLRTTTSTPQPLTAYNAIQDQYLAQAGVAHAVSSVKGLTLTLGPRIEGVPAANILGDDLGFRRPGFAISVEPGMIYARGNSMLQASVGKAVYRDRTRSVPDKMLGTHGDAAFADCVWLVSYTLRIPNGKHGDR
jgi:hypothetical protein